MKTWYRLAVPLFVSSLAYACTITTGDGDDFDWDDDDTAGAGNTSNKAGAGGSSSSAAGSANVAGKGGAVASGGTGTAGAPVAGSSGAGEDTTDLVCPSDELQGTPASTTEFEQGDDNRYTECLSCLQESCDSELKQCYASDPLDSCGYGITDRDGVNELFCYIECLVEIFDENGFVDPEEDYYTCATECGSQFDGMGDACNPVAISLSTQELTTCLHSKECDYACVDGIAEGGN